MLNSKLDLAGDRITLAAQEAQTVARKIFMRCGCPNEQASAIAEHLTESDLRGVESHGLMRVMQYAREFQNGAMNPHCRVRVQNLKPEDDNSVLWEMDGGIGCGIIGMQKAVDYACAIAEKSGIAGVALRNIGHSGRLAAFAESAADKNCFSIIIGGGDRQRWRMVAPYGGKQALLPTNPYCLGIPGGAPHDDNNGGDNNAVVLDFATGTMAGGWIYAAHSAGALLPENCLIDKHGEPTRKPQDYFDGGAILPKGILGYGLGLMAELIADAMLGKVQSGEAHWLILAIDCASFRDSDNMRQAAEAILAEMRACPPDHNGKAVQIPGERERLHKQKSADKIALPQKTWHKILELAQELSADL